MHRGVLKMKGFTLVEIVISIVIVSVALTALLLFTSESTRRSVDPLIQVQASAIAQSYLEEITQKGFCDPDWDHDSNPSTALDCPAQCTASACSVCSGTGTGWGTETRASYDDVCDYAGTDNPPLDQAGNSYATGLEQYSVTVSIDDSGTAILDSLAGNLGQVLRIDVTVSHPSMTPDVVMSAYRVNF